MFIEKLTSPLSSNPESLGSATLGLIQAKQAYKRVNSPLSSSSSILDLTSFNESNDKLR